MKKSFLLTTLIAVAMWGSVSPAASQENLSLKTESGFEAGIGADLVSRFVWRGMDQESGVSLQPSMSFSWPCGLTLGAWGNSSISRISLNEVDFTLEYEISGFKALFTDYYWGGDFSSFSEDHYCELTLEYCFGEKFPLTMSWASMLFAGENGELDEYGDRMFSSYFNISYDFDIKGVKLSPSIGFNPWKSQYDDDFSVMDIVLKVEKEVHINDSITLPVSAQLIVSPAMDKSYLVLGLSF
ncbi:MAG: hypothetical protein HUJ96_10330 [Marinilabiliaceae bacterium]|nr:hypothetical protein [Marinilabiliaceae bacterium]